MIAHKETQLKSFSFTAVNTCVKLKGKRKKYRQTKDHSNQVLSLAGGTVAKVRDGVVFTSICDRQLIVSLLATPVCNGV